MAKKRKPKVGRKPKRMPTVVIRLTLSLDPTRHANLIRQLQAAPERNRAIVAIDLMENGLPDDAPPLALGAEIDSSIDDL